MYYGHSTVFHFLTLTVMKIQNATLPLCHSGEHITAQRPVPLFSFSCPKRVV